MLHHRGEREGPKDMCVTGGEGYIQYGRENNDTKEDREKRIIKITTVILPLTCHPLVRPEVSNRNTFPQQMH